MSGGSYDYAYLKVDEFANDLRKIQTDPRRAAFAQLLRLVASAMRDIEWVDSCDNGPGDEHEAIDAVFSFLKADPETIAAAAAYGQLVANLKLWMGLTRGD